jgi:hypothetical protein
MIVCCWIKHLKFNVNSSYIFGFLNFYIVSFFLMSQVFKVRISECPSFWVKYYGNPNLIETLWGNRYYSRNATGRFAFVIEDGRLSCAVWSEVLNIIWTNSYLNIKIPIIAVYVASAQKLHLQPLSLHHFLKLNFKVGKPQAPRRMWCPSLPSQLHQQPLSFRYRKCSSVFILGYSCFTT